VASRQKTRKNLEIGHFVPTRPERVPHEGEGREEWKNGGRRDSPLLHHLTASKTKKRRVIIPHKERKGRSCEKKTKRQQSALARKATSPAPPPRKRKIGQGGDPWSDSPWFRGPVKSGSSRVPEKTHLQRRGKATCPSLTARRAREEPRSPLHSKEEEKLIKEKDQGEGPGHACPRQSREGENHPIA